MPMPLRDIRNQTFGLLRAIKHIGTARNGFLWFCICQCGGTITTLGSGWPKYGEGNAAILNTLSEGSAEDYIQAAIIASRSP
jgi:hypothetical protein